MKTPLDLTGNRYGRYIVIQLAQKRCLKNRYWICQCDCGTTTEVQQGNLTSGHSKSCGCYNIENKPALKHGQAKKGNPSIEYTTWCRMLQRCYDPKNPCYIYYGGRGIEVCERWRHSFETFLADMGNKPSPKFSIDRIDNNGHYCPENCRWTTMLEQANNTRANHLITHNNKTQSIAQWAREHNMSDAKLSQRITKYKWPIEKALLTP